MTADQRFERDLPDLLAQLAPGSTPDYRDHVVRQTARMRQRPGWTFPERWLPMSAVTSRMAALPRVPVRFAPMVALILLVLALVAVAAIGSRPRGPAPFGRAENGLVAYAAAGHIFTVDPTTGTTAALTSDPGTDSAPVFSQNGERILFQRASNGSSSLVTVRPDGSDPIAVTPVAWSEIATYEFSPDGRQIAYTFGPDDQRELWLVNTDGSGRHQVAPGMTISGAVFRPPEGAELIVSGKPIGGNDPGIYAVDVKTGTPRTIVEPAPGIGRDFVRLSPDGKRIAYSAATTVFPAPNSYKVHVVGIDGTHDMTLPMPARATFQDAPEWSNDGTRIAIVRGYAAHDEDMALAVMPADGSSPGIETDHGLIGCCNTVMEWSPDDTSILVEPFDGDQNVVRQLTWDPSSGAMHPSAWPAIGRPAWQRR